MSMKDEVEFGAPLGWFPKSGIIWNNNYLPYALRMDDMRFDLGLGTRLSSVVEIDLLTMKNKEWESYEMAEKHYRITGLYERMKKDSLLFGHILFYFKKTPPSVDRLKKLIELANVSRSFGYKTRSKDKDREEEHGKESILE